MAKGLVKIDRYGRILIPKDVRGRLGLEHGASLEVSVRGDELILRRVNTELRQKVDEWVELIERLAPKPFITEVRSGDSKWLSREYCLRKLGL